MGAEIIIDNLEDLCNLMCNNQLPKEKPGRNKCKDCAYLKPMKPDPDLMVCKNKNSQWYVVDPEKDKCKYFEKLRE